jgi:hypothetical protein
VVVAKVLQRGQIYHDGRGWVKVVPLAADDPAIRTSRCSAFSFSGSWHNQLWHNNPDYLVGAFCHASLDA